MMEENNRKGPGIFYAVTGVATLVVAIIGATFAYFTATVEPNTNTVTGTTAASSNVSLAVAPVYPESADLQGTKGRMLPMDDADLSTALTKKCLADDGYVACQVYEATLTNNGTESVYAKAMLSLSVGTIENMKWQRLSEAYAPQGTIETEVASPILLGTKDTETIAPSQSAKFYFVVWLSNVEDADQSGTDAGVTFTGTVSANVTNSTGSATTAIKATFAA